MVCHIPRQLNSSTDWEEATELRQGRWRHGTRQKGFLFYIFDRLCLGRHTAKMAMRLLCPAASERLTQEENKRAIGIIMGVYFLCDSLLERQTFLVMGCLLWLKSISLRPLVLCDFAHLLCTVNFEKEDVPLLTSYLYVWTFAFCIFQY